MFLLDIKKLRLFVYIPLIFPQVCLIGSNCQVPKLPIFRFQLLERQLDLGRMINESMLSHGSPDHHAILDQRAEHVVVRSRETLVENLVQKDGNLAVSCIQR